MDEPTSRSERRGRVPGGVAVGIGRFIVSLTWAILLVVAVAVVYLAMRFYGG